MEKRKELSPQQRMAMFNMATREYTSLIDSKTGSENGTLRFEIPQSKFLKRLRLEVTATLTATHASVATYTPHEDAPMRLLKNMTLDLSNGLKPINISGEACDLLERTQLGVVPTAVSSTAGRYRRVQPIVSSSGGTANSVKFTTELPLTLNDRDPIGLIFLQDPATRVSFNVTLGAVADLSPASSGYTFALSSIVLNLYGDYMSVPQNIDAFPDISVLKQVQEKTETLIAGQNRIKLPCSNVYRKIGLICYTSAPARIADTGITGNIEIVHQRSEIQYSITPSQLALINAANYGGPLSAGVFIFDFATMQNLPNIGGNRNYIDTEGSTEFEIVFTSGAAGTCKIITEELVSIAGV